MPGFSAVGEDAIGGVQTQATDPEGGGETHMTFTPSRARTLVVNPTRKTFSVITGTGDFWEMRDPKKPVGLKDPDATTDFTLDWTAWLLDVEDDIAAGGLSFQVNADLVVEGYTFVGPKCTVFLSGGTSGKTASVVCRITTVSVPPRIEDRTFNLVIEDR